MATSQLRQHEVKKASTRKGQDEQYVNLAMESMSVSRDNFRPWLRAAGRRYRLYRGYVAGKYVPYRANVSIPVAFSMVQSDAAKKANLSLINPVVQFEAFGPEDQALARKRDALVNIQLQDSNIWDKGLSGILGADIWGVQVYEMYWNTEQATVHFRADLGGG